VEHGSVYITKLDHTGLDSLAGCLKKFEKKNTVICEGLLAGCMY
jgi:hypothetical protein